MSRKATQGSGWRKGIQAKLRRRGVIALAPIFIITISSPFISGANAVENGVTVTFYDNNTPEGLYNNAPPLPPTTPVAGTLTQSQVLNYFDQEPLFRLYEDFVAQYQGNITLPDGITEAQFYAPADDGVRFFIDNQLIIDDWFDKGGGGSISAPVTFQPNISKPFTLWFYENGGGAWVELWWNLGPNSSWEIVPASAFSAQAIVPFIDAPGNVSVVDNGTEIIVSWDAPVLLNVPVERYAISWSTGNSGWGIATGNVGDENALNTSIVLSYDLFSSTGGFNSEYIFSVRADNDSLGVYSQSTLSSSLVITGPTTTTTTTTTTLPPPPPVTTTTTEAPVATTASTTTTTKAPLLQQAEQPQTTTTTLPAPVTTTTTTTIPPEVKAPVPAAATIALIQTVDELKKLVETVDLKSIEPDQAVALVTNAAFVELPKDQLSEVFESLPISNLSPEQEATLVAALSDAPSEVKTTFESAVDVYGSGLDEYVPEGSSVDVGTRRSVIAVTTVMSTVAAAGAAPGAGGGQPSGGSNGSPSDANKAARREEEQEDEEAGGLEGPEDREKNLNTRNSIYKYKENGQKEFTMLGFIKKFLKETAALSFTLAGSAIMFVTLSGDTRRIAMIATAAALTVHYVYVMLENDEE